MNLNFEYIIQQQWKIIQQLSTYFPSSSTSAGALPNFRCSSSSFFFLQSSLVIFFGSSKLISLDPDRGAALTASTTVADMVIWPPLRKEVKFTVKRPSLVHSNYQKDILIIYTVSYVFSPHSMCKEGSLSPPQGLYILLALFLPQLQFTIGERHTCVFKISQDSFSHIYPESLFLCMCLKLF